MKVLLINPAWGVSRPGTRRYHRAWPPLDLLVAASLLRSQGHEPILLDARAAGIGVEKIRAEADRADLVLLQSTPIDRWQCPNLDWETLRDLALKLPGEKTVLAGAHGTVRPEFMLSKTRVAAAIRGEPEAALAELAQSGGDPHNLPGLSYFDAGRVVHEPDRTPAGLDALPPPAYDLVDLDCYRYELLGPRLALLETSRGCPFSCAFCLKAMYGHGVRRKPLDMVLAEVEEIVGRRGARNVYFIDLEFTLRRDYTRRLCLELMRMNLDFRWCCQTRADTVDRYLLELMKAAGCELIHFGVETGSPHLLDTIHKRESLGQVRDAINWCRRLGLATACFFLFGLPGETGADRNAAIKLARELNPTFCSFHVAAPYPGTKMGRLAGEKEPFPACLDREHDLANLARQTKRAFMAFYLRPGYIWARLREGAWPDKLNRLKLFWEFIR